MNILKSSRHSKMTGDFAESLVLYWLSKYGFECARVDHTGIDLIARNSKSDELMGISVKSRCRISGKETEMLNIPADNFRKIESACNAFSCKPYFAIVIDAADLVRGFILPMSRLRELCPPTERNSYWKMSKSHLAHYAKDQEIKTFELKTQTNRWW
ncbi:MAG: hypothetical protein ABSA77_06665 [Thermoguttaceae bacterium]|jgi:Holliday junction resolvase-like predicted endonuclease